jgi:hypothetical protein
VIYLLITVHSAYLRPLFFFLFFGISSRLESEELSDSVQALAWATSFPVVLVGVHGGSSAELFISSSNDWQAIDEALNTNKTY